MTSTPSCSSPSSCDVRPPARRDEQALRLERVPAVELQREPRRSIARRVAPRVATRTRIPSCSNARREACPRPRSSRASRCSLCSTSVDLRRPSGGRTARARRRPARRRARSGSPGARSPRPPRDSSSSRRPRCRRAAARRAAIRSRRRARRTRAPARRLRRLRAARRARSPRTSSRALLLEPPGVPRVVTPVRDLVAPPEDALDVDLAGDRLGRARSEPGRGERLGRSQQRLRRQARVVRALAAGELPLDDRDLDVRIETTQRADEVLAARPGAEHDDALASAIRRRGRDLNPRRTFQHVRDFQSRSLGRSDTSPRGDSLARRRPSSPG